MEHQAVTVSLITSIHRYIGLSSDSKPSAPIVGSTFYETDTGLTSIYHDAAWQAQVSTGVFRASKTITLTGAAHLGQATGAYSPAITLSGAIDDVVTDIVVSSGANVINGQVILIETEQMLVTAGGGTANLTVTRAYGGTVAAAHADTTAITKASGYSTVPIFTVTGVVLIERLVPVVTVGCDQEAATATLALGTTDAATLFVAATNALAQLTAGKVWFTTTPGAVSIAVPAGFKDIAVLANIIATVATQVVNAGAIRFDVDWRPITAGAVLS